MTKPWQDKVILITGAGSGIGSALADLFAKAGASLILTDINQENLNTTQQRLAHAVIMAETRDVSVQDDWQQLAARVTEQVGYLDVLINNAGMSSFGYFDETSQALFEKVMAVNLNGVIMGCREMLPLLEQAERGLIVNVASIFGLITMPLMSPYHASKFAVRGFSEALKQDFAFQGKNVDVLCVMPGGIRTNIANYAESESQQKQDFAQHFAKVARTRPEQAAKVIEKGMRKKTFRILVGPDATLVDWLSKFLPTHYSAVLNPLFGVDKLAKPSSK